MSKDARQIQRELEIARSGVRSLESQLTLLQATCKHVFGAPVYDPIVQDAYRIPGDPPGTMGIDWRSPVDVPRSETKRWRRTCQNCTLTQTTEHTKTISKPGSVRGTTATEEVPDF